MAKKKQKKEKEIRTIFDSKIQTLSQAFAALENRQERNWWTVVTYEGNVALWQKEIDKIEEARRYFMELLEKDLTNK